MAISRTTYLAFWSHRRSSPVTSAIEMAGQLNMLGAAHPDIKSADDGTYTHLAEALAAFQTGAFRSDENQFDAVLRTGDLSILSAEA
ncbi:hypothetical protein [uncultured Sulfitobacter sp.]|uniref:hypothetical protein n=1 Tax=uncultured Sulfitobacter sp. TaxID=191468 RepID=UPI00261B7321|nr:hypothetical protein [uncultured Sulfitobacter sp.]